MGLRQERWLCQSFLSAVPGIYLGFGVPLLADRRCFRNDGGDVNAVQIPPMQGNKKVVEEQNAYASVKYKSSENKS